MRLRPLTPDDASGCATLAVERGWRPHAEAWRVALSLGRGLGAESPDGGLAAAALLVGHGRDRSILFALVSPRHGGQGLGRRLAQEMLAAAGAAAVEVYVPPAAVSFASRLGFRTVGYVTRFVGRPRPLPRSGAAATLRPIGGADFPAVVAVDEVAFGALRRPLLEALFPMAVRACLAADGGRTVGYGLAWHDGDQLAVGPIVAEEESVAAAMAAWLLGSGEEEVRIDVPDERTGIAGIAWASGLRPAGRITRLALGEPSGGRRERLAALAAPWAG